MLSSISAANLNFVVVVVVVDFATAHAPPATSATYDSPYVNAPSMHAIAASIVKVSI